MAAEKKNNIVNSIDQLFKFLHDKVMMINGSKFFAGLMIIILNISSRFVTIKLSKTMESYLKYTFSRDILVFAISWMGTRDIYVAFIMTAIFILCFDFLFNESSSLCCLPEQFTDYHISLLENNDKVSDDDIKKAQETLDKAKKQKEKEKEKEKESQNPQIPNTPQPPQQLQPQKQFQNYANF